MNKKINIILKELRTKRELSQAEVARQLDIARPTYIQMEKGIREPTISEIEKLSGIFSVPINTFFTSGESVKSFLVSLPKMKKTPILKASDIRINVPQKNLEKFKETLLYILEKVGAKSNVGETVIYKLLYFIDFDYYEKYEEQLIGATYIKNKFGPTPVEFKKIAEEMIKEGEMEIVRSRRFQYEQKKYLPLRRSNLSALSAREIKHIDGVLDRLSDKTAKELSEYSHGDIPWKVHEMGEKIDYEYALYRDDKYSVREYEDEL